MFILTSPETTASKPRTSGCAVLLLLLVAGFAFMAWQGAQQPGRQAKDLEDIRRWSKTDETVSDRVTAANTPEDFVAAYDHAVQLYEQVILELRDWEPASNAGKAAHPHLVRGYTEFLTSALNAQRGYAEGDSNALQEAADASGRGLQAIQKALSFFDN